MFLDKSLYYKVDLTRVHKKNVAPAGKIFLVVNVKQNTKEGARVYTNYTPILVNTPEDMINEMAQLTVNSIKKKYKL